jgi:hypothetical protein
MLGKRHLLVAWLWFGVLAAAMGIALNGTTGVAQQTTVSLETPGDKVKLEDPAFTVSLVIDNVENLAGFQFSLEFDATVLEATAVEEGPFLGSSGREVMCGGAEVAPGNASLLCVSVGPTVSQGGVAGPDGGGVLAVVNFIAVGEGETALGLRNVSLVEAEVDEAGMPIGIAAASVDGTMSVAGGGGFAWVLWGPVIAVGAVLVVSAGAGSIWWFRLRHPGPSSAAAPE